MDEQKFVNFDAYCPHCQYADNSESDDPCDECLSIPARYNSHKPEKYKDKEGLKYIAPDDWDRPDPYYGTYDEIEFVKDYLFKVTYNKGNKLNQDYAMWYLNEGSVTPGMCSSVRNGNFYGRNYDWTYDDSSQFVVKLERRLGARPDPGRLGVLGITGAVKGLNDEFVTSGTLSYIYKVLPFMLQDGINSAGVVANMNVVPTDGYKEIDIHGHNGGTINALSVVSMVLMNCASAFSAITYLNSLSKIVMPKKLIAGGYDLHYMIADQEDTYIVEFVNGKLKFEKINAKPYMTNFRLYGVDFNEDGSVYTPETQSLVENAVDTNHIHRYGSGLERYNYIHEHYSECGDLPGMNSLMNDLKYTKAYLSAPEVSDPYWYTEFVGGDLTCKSSPNRFNYIINRADEEYTKRTRTNGGKTWQTVHTSVYDLAAKKLYLTAQEDGSELIYTL